MQKIWFNLAINFAEKICKNQRSRVQSTDNSLGNSTCRSTNNNYSYQHFFKFIINWFSKKFYIKRELTRVVSKGLLIPSVKHVCAGIVAVQLFISRHWKVSCERWIFQRNALQNVRNLIANSYFPSNFKIYWSIPTSTCRKFQIDFSNLSASHGFVQNTNDSVRWVQGVDVCLIALSTLRGVSEVTRLPFCMIQDYGLQLKRVEMVDWFITTEDCPKMEVLICTWDNSRSTSIDLFQTKHLMESLWLILNAGDQLFGRILATLKCIETSRYWKSTRNIQTGLETKLNRREKSYLKPLQLILLTEQFSALGNCDLSPSGAFTVFLIVSIAIVITRSLNAVLNKWKLKTTSFSLCFQHRFIHQFT